MADVLASHLSYCTVNPQFSQAISMSEFGWFVLFQLRLRSFSVFHVSKPFLLYLKLFIIILIPDIFILLLAVFRQMLEPEEFFTLHIDFDYLIGTICPN
jgi:hypothetical protein